jgi:hypothetical protein
MSYCNNETRIYELSYRPLPTPHPFWNRLISDMQVQGWDLFDAFCINYILVFVLIKCYSRAGINKPCMYQYFIGPRRAMG